jgi:hypothetical protein
VKYIGCMLILLTLAWLPPARAVDTNMAVTPAALEGVPEAVPPHPSRDPFRPFSVNIRPQPQHLQVTPLQRYELGQLTVAATVWEVSPPRAMLQDSVGMGYIVTLGTPIGPNGGLVTSIEPERVIVEERVLDFYGKEQVNRIVMETPKEDGDNQPREQK